MKNIIILSLRDQVSFPPCVFYDRFKPAFAMPSKTTAWWPTLISCPRSLKRKLPPKFRHISRNLTLKTIFSWPFFYHSTETTHLFAHNNIRLFLYERQDFTGILLFDLSAAFDMIDCQILLDRLNECFGLGVDVLKLAVSYIKHHFQSFQIMSIQYYLIKLYLYMDNTGHFIHSHLIRTFIWWATPSETFQKLFFLPFLTIRSESKQHNDPVFVL